MVIRGGKSYFKILLSLVLLDLYRIYIVTSSLENDRDVGSGECHLRQELIIEGLTRERTVPHPDVDKEGDSLLFLAFFFRYGRKVSCQAEFTGGSMQKSTVKSNVLAHIRVANVNRVGFTAKV